VRDFAIQLADIGPDKRVAFSELFVFPTSGQRIRRRGNKAKMDKIGALGLEEFA
jgi:hypothetical protein